MSKNDLSVVAILVGCLALAWAALGQSRNAQHERYLRYRYVADKPLDVDRLAKHAVSQRFEYRRPCEQSKGRDESELCAQWLAAKAGEDSALYAKWSVGIGIFGLFGLFASLYYTRKAVETATDANKDADEALAIARQNANAAAELARIAETTARHDLRAYVDFEHVGLARDSAKDTEDREWAGLAVALRNFGKTPAKNLSVHIIHGRWMSPGLVSGTIENIKDNIGGIAPSDTLKWQDFFGLQKPYFCKKCWTINGRYGLK